MMIVPGVAAATVAVTVTLWSHEEGGGELVSEIGWVGIRPAVHLVREPWVGTS
jgi:hypothetical protein